MLWPERNEEIRDDWWGTTSSPWRTVLSPKFLISTFLHYRAQNNMFLKCTNVVILSALRATAYKAMLLRQEYSLPWWLVPSFIFPLPWMKRFACEHWCHTRMMIADDPYKPGGRWCVSSHVQMLLVTVGKGQLRNITLPTTCISLDLQSVQRLDWPASESAQSLIWC